MVFPGFGITDAAESALRLGASWESASTPFMRFEGNLAVTHVGVLEIPMSLMGELVTVGGIHGVATHPEFRRRGYYRDVMEEVLDYCDRHYKTLVLTTSEPELYEPFGFRYVREHVFVAQCNSTGGTHGFRLLDTNNDNDINLLNRLLETREPVSYILGVVKAKALFCVIESRSPLFYAEDLDVLVCMNIEGSTLKLFDLVGTKVCSLQALVDRIPHPIEDVEIYFSPDRLHVKAQALPHQLNGDDCLMVRGEFAPENRTFMLPRSARC
ncbi:GNAT family N-acetyltransferase [Tolypothrix bouteillei VB521301]|uniref:GCN5-related N-acetyltransferase n=1 Tax=Tolypothrix bouteillei VB521301 TaxID=1479485 RepID=A0A0C1NA00_9CYAN|nr:GNAT family N-acetyltransferase [Tolypothrix bouteillei VB521301]